MSKIVELSDEVYESLRAVADASGLTAAEWIERCVGEQKPWAMPTFPPPEAGGPRSPAERLAKYIGRRRSAVPRNAAVDAGSEAYADDLEQKKREGTL